MQEALAAWAAPAWLREAPERYDVVVAGVHAPKSDGLYQASRAATYLGLAARPAVAEGGLIVLAADMPLGAGDGPGERNFLDVLAAASSPAELLERGLREPLGPGGQRSFVVARVLARFRLAVAGAADPAFLEPLAHLGVAAFDSVDAALAAEERPPGPPRLGARRRRRDGDGRHRRLTARARLTRRSRGPRGLARGTTHMERPCWRRP